jgi:quercetin dioxygenase-like cupin family protein
MAVGRGYVLGAGEGVPGGGDPALKASGPSTGGALTLFESDTDGGAPRHVHSREDECFYVVEGTMSVECGDDAWEAGPSSFVFLPRGIPHAWDVVGDRATVLIMTVPAGFEEFMREFHEAGGSARLEVGRRHGIEFL